LLVEIKSPEMKAEPKLTYKVQIYWQKSKLASGHDWIGVETWQGWEKVVSITDLA